MDVPEKELLTAREIGKAMGKHSRTVKRMGKREGWPFVKERFKGGMILKYFVKKLPSKIQKGLGRGNGDGGSEAHPHQSSTSMVPINQGSPFAPLSSPHNGDLKGATPEIKIWTPGRAINPADLTSPHFAKINSALRELDEMELSGTKGRTSRIKALARKYDVDRATVFRWVERREKRDIAGLRHGNSSQGKTRSWDIEGLKYWMGLTLKREHRGICLKDLYYDLLLPEAHRQGWRIGKYRTAVWWWKKIKSPLKALSRGGERALDNALPPILRKRSDAKPFEIINGDQHRADYWLQDDETGEIFRPEIYIWQDWCTSIIYGLATDKRYDSWLMGIGLRMGIRCYGPFGSIFTDNGRPECSHYLKGILEAMKTFGMTWEQTIDLSSGTAEAEGEEISPRIRCPGSHIKANFENAKSKWVERLLRDLNAIMQSHFRLAGRTKRLTEDIHWQDVDQREAEKLAKAGKLLLASEHAVMMYRAADYYNREKPHRGLLKDWIWKPKPSEATPYDCLMAHYENGWRPKRISEEAVDLVFLPKDERVVRLGRIEFRGDFYEHEELIGIEGRVDIRFNPMDLSEILVFHKGKYLCTAIPVEYSSMRNLDLAQRKIQEKRARAKRFSEEFKRLTGNVPDFRQYSTVPKAERVAALVGAEKKKRAAQRADLYRSRPLEELEAQIRKNEEAKLLPATKDQKPVPERPAFFHSELDHYKWARDYRRRGGSLGREELTFVAGFEARMSPQEAEYWAAEREMYEKPESKGGRE